MKKIAVFTILCCVFFVLKPYFSEKYYMDNLVDNYFDTEILRGSNIKEVIHIKYIKDTDHLIIVSKRGWEHRVVNSIDMFVNAFNIVRNKIENDFSVDIDTSDFTRNDKAFAFNFRGGKSDKLIPDFLFVSWPETGIDNYDEACRQIENAGKEPYVYDKIFWIGNASTNAMRRKLVKIGAENENFEFIPMRWFSHSEDTSEVEKLKRVNATTYVSLPDHTKYKYLIDVPGIGYSARVKLLLFSGRPLFYVARQDEEFYMKDLKPFVHYIPVKGDLSDLEEKYQWAEEHYDEAQQIARNALDYAKTHLTKNAVLVRYSHMILDYAESQKKQPLRPKFLPINQHQ